MGRPIAVSLPSLVDGEVTIDEAGSVDLVVDEESEWRRIFGAPPNPALAGFGGREVDHGQWTDVPCSAVCCAAGPGAGS
jgi:hypothetical protein